MDGVTLLTDYKGHFGSKHAAVPYRSGFDRDLLARSFAQHGWRADFLSFCDVDFRAVNWHQRPVLYTSAQDHALHYKAFVEDIVLGLETAGAWVIPPFRLLRAHHNKVFMEILRDLRKPGAASDLAARSFGTLEELRQRMAQLSVPAVVKPAAGDMGKSVILCRDRSELLRGAARVSSSRHLPTDLWDLGRRIRRKGYRRESLHRKRFIVQPFLAGLTNDWKVLVYGRKYYVLRRRVRTGDFRASGSGRFEFVREVPSQVLDFASAVFAGFEVPQISLDIAVDGDRLHLLEFQAVYFGTTTIDEAPFHFERSPTAWQPIDGASRVEEEFALSVAEYLRERKSEQGAGTAAPRGADRAADPRPPVQGVLPT
ncbi:MAG TPA: hypothetical protein VFW45_13120 [Candidatus Polarisedimenticolia bacterium]|nr:hypothetical protein [Candidatus Polarisedimenticolia bacterium]